MPGAPSGVLLPPPPRHRRAQYSALFPTLSLQERSAGGRGDGFSGQSFLKPAWRGFMPHRRLQRLIDLQGLEHLQSCPGAGQGVVLFAMHFTHLSWAQRQ